MILEGLIKEELQISKNTRISVDGATVKTKDQDLIVSPRRLSMFLTTIIIGGFGALSLIGSVLSLINTLSEGDAEAIGGSIMMALIGGGLLSVAYFSFNKGKTQKAVYFDTTNRQVKIGNETFPFNSITGVYLRKAGSMTLGDISGIIIQTGIVSNNTAMPIASVSKAKQPDNMMDAITLIQLYTEHLGYDPHILGRTEELSKINLQTNMPAVLPFKATS